MVSRVYSILLVCGSVAMLAATCSQPIPLESLTIEPGDLIASDDPSVTQFDPEIHMYDFLPDAGATQASLAFSFESSDVQSLIVTADSNPVSTNCSSDWVGGDYISSCTAGVSLPFSTLEIRLEGFDPGEGVPDSGTYWIFSN